MRRVLDILKAAYLGLGCMPKFLAGGGVPVLTVQSLPTRHPTCLGRGVSSWGECKGRSQHRCIGVLRLGAVLLWRCLRGFLKRRLGALRKLGVPRASNAGAHSPPGPCGRGTRLLSAASRRRAGLVGDVPGAGCTGNSRARWRVLSCVRFCLFRPWEALTMPVCALETKNPRLGGCARPQVLRWRMTNANINTRRGFGYFADAKISSFSCVFHCRQGCWSACWGRGVCYPRPLHMQGLRCSLTPIPTLYRP